MFKMMGDLPRIFSSNEQLRRGHSFTVLDTVSQSSEAMAVDGYSLLPTTSDDEAQNLATPQTWTEAHKCKLKLLPWCTVFVAVFNLQIINELINDPAHPEILHQWLPWLFGPGLTPEALVWSAWTQAIILPLLGALGTASFILRLGSSKSSRMEHASLAASLGVFVQLSVWEECLLGPLGRPQGASH